MPERIIIATRESRLALWQAEHVRDLLAQRFGMAVDLLGMTTTGDRIVDRTLAKAGGKGLFVKELEAALEEGRAQLAVHSLKDVPMNLPAGFELAAVLEREDPRDALVSSRYASIDDLPQGAAVGSSSARARNSIKQPLCSTYRRICSTSSRRKRVTCSNRAISGCHGFIVRE